MHQSESARYWIKIGISLALLCLIAYLPTLSIPLIQDDYPIISLSRHFGNLTGLPALLHSPADRLRTTALWLTRPLWRQFGLASLPYHLASLLLHMLNTGLVFALVAVRTKTRQAAWWSAAFFAVHEGHQEAIMWFSAANELLLFLFGAGSLLCWIEGWIEAESRRSIGWRMASILLFSLALLSKESAVIFLPLLVLVSPREDWRRTLLRLLPFAILGAVAVVSIICARSSSFRFSDGSFSVHAPFWITWPRSLGRLLWIWGWLACAVLLFAKPRLERFRRWAVPALLWMGIALIPYSFNTYSTQIPSRHTYLASAGLAMLVGLALAGIVEELRWRRAWVTALVAIVLIYNVGWLWMKKRPQFLQRGEPSEHLIRFAREHPGPIWIACYPHNERMAAEEALRLALGRPPSSLVWSEAEASRTHAAMFCDAGMAGVSH